MENKTKEEKMQEPKFDGWRSAQIDENLPIAGLVQFLNILNQRLILVEDALTMQDGDERITLSEYWVRVQKQEYQKMLEEMQKQQEEQEKAQSQAN
jgi:hypothetical protein